MVPVCDIVHYYMTLIQLLALHLRKINHISVLHHFLIKAFNQKVGALICSVSSNVCIIRNG